MKNIETILTQLTDTNILLDSLYQAIAEVDPDYLEEMNTYDSALQALMHEIPQAEACVDAMRQELASDVRFAMWQGFQWHLDCARNPVNKLMANLDFEELCQESKMHALPAAQEAQQTIRTFLRALPKEQQELFDPIIDHFAYLKTYGYKLAYSAGFELASDLLPLVAPGMLPIQV